ncbi:MAG TPA: hypothetical protein VFO06_02385, partial [Gemmatimonadales bacterium]|nr:hypothetical protein [Gemmatimonadales bacterium]
AGLAIYGRLDLAEGDSVRLRATLIDVVEDRLLGEVDRADERNRLDRLQDSAGVDVLRLLGRVPTGGTVLYGSLRTRSIAALKEFLRGEQHYRRSRWDSALAHYGLAARLDTSFALANRRMFQVLGWDPPSAARFDRGHVYLHRAVAANRGLSLKDSLLIQVDSMAAAESGQTFGAEYRYFFATLDTLARRFPDDPEVWQVIGEERFHFGIPPEGGWQAALDAFLKAVELDSALSPAYVHTVELAIRLGDERLARRLARAYLTLAPTDGSVDAIRLASRLLDARTSPAERRRLIESAATVPVLQASLILDHWPDSAESAVALARTLALSATHRDEGAPAYVRDPSARALLLASQLALRGHLSAADSVFAALSLPDLRYARHRLGQGGSWIDIGLLRGPGGASTGKGVRIALEGDIAWYEGGREALAWWNAIGDTAAMMDFADRAGRFARARKTSDTLARPWSLGHAAYLTAVAVGYQLLARGDTAGALERLLALPDSMCIIVSCFHEKLITGRLLAARGRPVEAAALLDAWTGTSSHGALYVLATLERARLAERLGERGLARKRYAFVAAMWARGDSVVRPYVVEAESALVRLGQEVQEVPRAR